MAARIRAAADTRHQRLAVASRILAATAGGYALASAIAILLGTMLAADPATATIAATLAGVLAMPAAAMACIRVRSATRAWAGVAAAAILCIGLALAGGWRP